MISSIYYLYAVFGNANLNIPIRSGYHGSQNHRYLDLSHRYLFCSSDLLCVSHPDHLWCDSVVVDRKADQKAQQGVSLQHGI